ncbi:MAG: hypothetical protein ACRC10_12970 [Thermoguttaceae bacterium]
MGRVYHGREIDAALRKKGFHRNVDGKHIVYSICNLADETEYKVLTHLSHGMSGTTVSAKLLSQMSRQLRLRKDQFLALIDCSLDETQYRLILQEQGESV